VAGHAEVELDSLRDAVAVRSLPKGMIVFPGITKMAGDLALRSSVGRAFLLTPYLLMFWLQLLVGFVGAGYRHHWSLDNYPSCCA